MMHIRSGLILGATFNCARSSTAAIRYAHQRRQFKDADVKCFQIFFIKIFKQGNQRYIWDYVL